MAEQDFTFFPHEEIEEAKQYTQQHGVSGLAEYVKYKTEQWKYVSVNIGIVGESAVGKSSFINCIRGLTADDPDGAAVGTGDTTSEPTKYCHPYNEELVFWDLPGVGTPKYPRNEEYLKNINFEKYDFFLLLSDNRFSSNDVWLAREIEKRGKHFFFVRTKIDEAMENERQLRGSAFSAAVVLDKINKNCEESFKAAQLTNRRVFCISNYHREMWQFEELMQELLVALPDMKRNALVLSIGPVSKQVIKEKTKLLKKQISWKAALSAVGAAGGSLVTIPFVGGAVGVAVDIVILVAEINFYLKQYGLDEDSLKQLSERTNTTVDYYVKSLKFASEIIFRRQGIKTFVIDMIKKEAVNEGRKRVASEFLKLIPFVGSIGAGAISFGTCYYFLDKTINEFETDALAVVDAVIRKTQSEI